MIDISLYIVCSFSGDQGGRVLLRPLSLDMCRRLHWGGCLFEDAVGRGETAVKVRDEVKHESTLLMTLILANVNDENARKYCHTPIPLYPCSSVIPSDLLSSYGMMLINSDRHPTIEYEKRKEQEKREKRNERRVTSHESRETRNEKREKALTLTAGGATHDEGSV